MGTGDDPGGVAGTEGWDRSRFAAADHAAAATVPDSGPSGVATAVGDERSRPRARKQRGRWLRRMLALGFAGYLGALGSYWLAGPLVVPVAGVPADRLVSTFGAPRGGGSRRHEGIDIFARRGTTVQSTGWGLVIFRGTLSLGGKVVVTVGQGGMLCYYAHLDRWAERTDVGTFLGQGEALGTVGNTGNARTTRPHLHFEARPLYRLLLPVDPLKVLRA